MPLLLAAGTADAARLDVDIEIPTLEVAEYHRRKADDVDRWLAGMRRFQDSLFPDGPKPGDAIAPRP